MTRAPALLVSLPFVIAACAGDAQRTDVDAPAAALVEELRLDPHTEDFSVVRQVWVGPRRQIVVPQPQDRQLRLYDSAGTHIATVGREGGGSGPGEFEALNLMGWVADTLWVYDGLQRRVTYVTPDGRVLRTTQLPASLRSGAPIEGSTKSVLFFSPQAIREDGTMLGEGRIEDRSDPRAQDGWPERAFLLGHPDATPANDDEASGEASEPTTRAARVIAFPPAYEDGRWYMTVSGFGRPIPFAARPLVDYASDGSRFAYLMTELGDDGSGTFTVTTFDASGDTIMSRSYPYRGIAVPDRVRDSTLAAFIPPAGAPREGPSDLPQRFQAIARERMPGYYPPVLEMVLGLDDSIWLTLRDTADARRAMVLGGDGEPLAEFPMPARATIRQGTRTHVWMTQTDDDGLAAVLRYRVERR